MNFASTSEGYSKMSKESIEMLFQGLDMYNKITRSWLEFAELSYKQKPEDILKTWTESFTGIYKDLIEMSSRPFRLMGLPNLPGKASWEEVFKTWQKFVESAPMGMVPPQEGMEEYIKLSKEWQENYSKFYNAWLDYLQKMGETYKSTMERSGDGQMLKSSLESSESLMDAWVSFVTTETKELFQYWKSMMLKGAAGETAA
jgi:hypothetical protein